MVRVEWIASILWIYCCLYSLAPAFQTTSLVIEKDLDRKSFLATNDVNLDSGLVVFYPFNGNADDQSGNNHDGVVNGATLTEDRFGNNNAAYLFDGVDDFIQLPDDNLLEIDFPLSTSVWVKMDSSIGFFDQGVFNTDFVENNYHGINLNVSPDGVREFYGDGSGCTCSSARKGVRIDTILAVDVYHSVICIFESANSFKLYLNGQLVSTTPWGDASANIAYTAAGGVIGKNDPNSSFPELNFFKGAIDDFRIYNRILNASEIDSLYYEGCPPVQLITNEIIGQDTTLGAVQQLELNNVSVHAPYNLILRAPEILIDQNFDVPMNAKLETISQSFCKRN